MPPPPLLTAVNSAGHIHLVIGTNPLASSRCAKSLEVGAKPIVIAPAAAAAAAAEGDDCTEVHYLLAQRIEAGEVEWIKREFKEEDVTSLGREEVDGVVDAVFVTTTTMSGNVFDSASISQLCKRKRIAVNVVDAPHLCTFTLLSTHSDGPLQIGITTSGSGCKLASRIRREIANTLPKNFGDAVERLGIVRRRIWEEDHRLVQPLDKEQGQRSDPDGTGEGEGEGDDDRYTAAQRPTFNRFISEDDASAAKTRRMRWLAQICEYWPLKQLAAITDADIETLLESYTASKTTDLTTTSLNNTPPTPPKAKKPRIILAGSGPGSPSLLTLATYHFLQTAPVILTDKLVPSAILNLIPRRTTVHIARKFPGNADAAQTELLNLGLQALHNGHTVLRLKQGDPYLYGRGGEEFAFFSEHGYTPVVVPGITSALAAPLCAKVPATNRGVADQVFIVTGTGRKGAAPELPSYGPSRTCVFLMALHRLESLVEGLTGGRQRRDHERKDETPEVKTAVGVGVNGAVKANGHAHSESQAQSHSDSQSDIVPQHHQHQQQLRPVPWPSSTPCAIIERASCPDQRVIRSTLANICAAVEEEGSRPPGLLVVGWCCEVLLDEEVKGRLMAERGRGKGRGWVVEEGFEGFEGVDIEGLSGVGDLLGIVRGGLKEVDIEVNGNDDTQAHGEGHKNGL